MTDSPQKDDQVVRQVLAGDRDAFRVLVDRYHHRVYAVTYRLLGDQTEAEEMTQQTFYEAYMALPRFAQKCSFQGWLMRIAVNNCKDFQKSHKRRESQLGHEVEGGQALFSGTIHNPEQAIRASRLGQAVAQALQEMDPKYRIPLVLKDIDGLSYNEMQQVLDLSLANLKSRVVRARAKLRGALEWNEKS